MTDEHAVRKNLQKIATYGRIHSEDIAAALALLDAKDAELREYKEALAFTESERDTALSRAEQAEAALAEANDTIASLKTVLDTVEKAVIERDEMRAALAEERKKHQAFREEVDAKVRAWQDAGCQGPYAIDDAVDGLHSLILPAKPAVDPLVEAIKKELPDWCSHGDPKKLAVNLRAAIERAGGTIAFGGDR